LNKGLAKVARARGGEVSRCIKAFAKAKEGSAVACIAADSKRKVAKALDALVQVAQKRCSEPPDFGPTDASIAGTAGAEGAADLLADLLGDVDAALALESADPERAGCQRSLVTAARKCHDASLGEFNRCKKAGLKDGSIASAADLGACLASDPKGKVARACDLGSDGEAKVDPLRAALRDACADDGVELPAALPPCGETDVEAAHSCVRSRIGCRVCRELAAADGLTSDCDAVDDGQANASCSP
jgi:hypothetical protein